MGSFDNPKDFFTVSTGIHNPKFGSVGPGQPWTAQSVGPAGINNSSSQGSGPPVGQSWTNRGQFVATGAFGQGIPAGLATDGAGNVLAADNAGGVYLTTNGGHTWTVQVLAMPNGFICNGGIYYGNGFWLQQGSDNTGNCVYRSNDTGVTWTRVALPSGAAYITAYLATNGTGTWMLAASGSTPSVIALISTNDGASFGASGSPFVASLDRGFFDGTHFQFFAGTDLYSGTADGTSWVITTGSNNLLSWYYSPSAIAWLAGNLVVPVAPAKIEHASNPVALMTATPVSVSAAGNSVTATLITPAMNYAFYQASGVANSADNITWATGTLTGIAGSDYVACAIYDPHNASAIAMTFDGYGFTNP